MQQRRLTGRDLEIATRVKQSVLAIFPDAEVILYGSRARRRPRRFRLGFPGPHRRPGDGGAGRTATAGKGYAVTRSG